MKANALLGHDPQFYRLTDQAQKQDLHGVTARVNLRNVQVRETEGKEAPAFFCNATLEVAALIVPGDGKPIQDDIDTVMPVFDVDGPGFFDVLGATLQVNGAMTFDYTDARIVKLSAPAA